jgi:hypothetical protein
MNKIEKKMLEALKDSVNFSSPNTTVSCGDVFLFGNHIAKVSDGKANEINFQGWVTRTTSSRLNALLQDTKFRVHSIKGVPYLRNWKTQESLKISSSDWVVLSDIDF